MFGTVRHLNRCKAYTRATPLLLSIPIIFKGFPLVVEKHRYGTPDAYAETMRLSNSSALVALTMHRSEPMIGGRLFSMVADDIVQIATISS